MDAERAARRIVRGILAGRPVVITTPLAQVAPRVDALLPTLTSAFLALTTRLLPKAPVSTDGETLEGWQAEQGLRTRSRLILDRLTVLGRRAAGHFNEGA